MGLEHIKQGWDVILIKVGRKSLTEKTNYYDIRDLREMKSELWRYLERISHGR